MLLPSASSHLSRFPWARWHVLGAFGQIRKPTTVRVRGSASKRMSEGSSLPADLQLFVAQRCSESFVFEPCEAATARSNRGTGLIGFGGTTASTASYSLVRHVLVHPLLRVVVPMPFTRALCRWPSFFTFRRGRLPLQSAGRLQTCQAPSKPIYAKAPHSGACW